ncbi:MAG: ComEC/Rec2 family competence protein [Flavobacteriales bacterium]
MNARFGSSLPLVRPALALVLGILFGRMSSISLPLWCLAILFGLLVLLHATKTPREAQYPIRSMLVLLCFVALGYRSYQETRLPYTTMAEGRIEGRLHIAGNPRCNDYKCRVVATVNLVDTTGFQRLNKLELVVPARFEAQLIEGSMVKVTGRGAPFRHPPNPYQYDPVERAKAQNLTGQLIADSIAIVHQAEYGWRLRGQRWLWAGLSGIDNARVRGMCFALLTGDKSELDNDLRTAFARCGTMHLLAVSGLHAGLVAWLPLLLMRRYRQRHWSIILFAVVIAVVWGFAWFTGMSASVIRAASMLSMMALGLLIRKRVSTLNALAAAALFMLLSEPDLLFNAGFLLSFLAVAAIVSFTPIIREQLPVTRRKWLNGILGSSSVTLAAQAGTTPVSLYCFNQMPILFLPANLVAVPLGTLLLYLLMLHTVLLSAGVDFGALTWLINAIGRVLIGASEAIASLKWAAAEGIALSLTATVLLAVSTVVYFAILVKKAPRNWWPILPLAIAFIVLLPQQRESSSELVFFSQYKGVSIGLRNAETAYVLADETSGDFAFGGWLKQHRATVIRLASDTLFYLDGWRIERCNDRFNVGPLVLLPTGKNAQENSELGGWRLRRKWNSWLLIHPKKENLDDWNWDDAALRVQFN